MDKNTTEQSYILIVDDHSKNLQVLGNILKANHYKTLPANSGKLALQFIEKKLPDLILLDIMMPEMDGYEVCKLLKSNDATKDIPIIFISALNELEDKVTGIKTGGVDYITKPFEPEEVLARVNAHLTIRKLQKQLQRRNVFLEKINNIVKSINSEVDLGDLLKSILKECFVVKGVEQAFALIYDTSLNAYTFKASVGLDVNKLEQIQISFNEVEEWYINDSEEIYEDIFIVEHIQGKPNEKKFRYIGIPKAMLIIKIRIEQHVEGYLIFVNMTEEQAFEYQDIQLLENLKDYIISAFIKSKLLSELQKANRKLEEISLTDPLTGMRNRRLLSKYIHNDIAKVHRDYHEALMGKMGNQPVNSDIVFLMLDLDHFKSVNDTYGHEAGDRVLIQVREILESVCRDSDILVRWGGEEFLIVSRYSNQDHAQIIAERIREKVENHPFDIGSGQTIHLTCSIGSASYPFLPAQPDSLNWEQVVAIADKVLYAAKMSGRNVYVNIMSTEATSPHHLFQRIRKDIESLIHSGELQVGTSLPNERTLIFQ